MCYIFYFPTGQSGAQDGGGTSGANARIDGTAFRASKTIDNPAKANKNSNATFFMMLSDNGSLPVNRILHAGIF